jgi:hypothetical protein
VPERDDFVKVTIRCNRCGNMMPGACVHVERNVPERLRCSPGFGSPGPREIRCSKCGAPCFEDIRELGKAVAAETQRGWGAHQRAGAVIVECRG